MKPFSIPAFTACLLCLLLVPLPAANAGSDNAVKAGLPSAVEKPRIVAAGGVITEIIYALGRSDIVVGVDSTSHFPTSALKEKPNVGYVRALSSEGLLSLKPTAVIAIDDAGPPDVLKAIEGAGVHIYRIPEVATPQGIADKIEKVASLIGENEKGAALAASTTEQFKSLETLRKAIQKPKRALFILSFQNGRAMVGAKNTSADGIMTLAGLQNAASGLEGWKPISDEALVDAAPDVIIAMRRGAQPMSPDTILAVPAFAATPAGKSKNVLIFDGEYLLGFGPRTPSAAHDLLVAAYPGLEKQDVRSNSQ